MLGVKLLVETLLFTNSANAVLSAVNLQAPVSADQEEMLKDRTAAGLVGAPLADLTLSNKAPSVVSVTSQCSYSSTIVHVPHPESGKRGLDSLIFKFTQTEVPHKKVLSI